MKKFFVVLLSAIFIPSCIPLRIAPKIDDYNVTQGKRFKRDLPEREMFIFADPKEAEMFYNYVDIKYALNNENVYDDVPFQVNQNQYFFSFYETEIPDKHINLFPLIADVFLNAAIGNDEIEPILSNGVEEVQRAGNWYIAIEVYSDAEKDCLSPDSLSREAVLKYLRNLKEEYLATNNYNELVFKN